MHQLVQLAVEGDQLVHGEDLAGVERERLLVDLSARLRLFVLALQLDHDVQRDLAVHPVQVVGL